MHLYKKIDVALGAVEKVFPDAVIKSTVEHSLGGMVRLCFEVGPEKMWTFFDALATDAQIEDWVTGDAEAFRDIWTRRRPKYLSDSGL